MIVTLCSGINVNPDHVVSVTREYYGRAILVKTVDGQVHECPRQYRESEYEAEARIVKALNAATERK